MFILVKVFAESSWLSAVINNSCVPMQYTVGEDDGNLVGSCVGGVGGGEGEKDGDRVSVLVPKGM